MTRRVHSLHYLCQLLEIGERHSLTNACLMELAGLLQEIVPELPSLGTDGKLQVLWPTTTSLTVGVNQMLASQPSASSSNHFLDPNETTSEVFASRPTASTSNLFLDIHEKTSAQGHDGFGCVGRESYESAVKTTRMFLLACITRYLDDVGPYESEYSERYGSQKTFREFAFGIANDLIDFYFYLPAHEYLFAPLICYATIEACIVELKHASKIPRTTPLFKDIEKYCEDIKTQYPSVTFVMFDDMVARARFLFTQHYEYEVTNQTSNKVNRCVRDFFIKSQFKESPSEQMVEEMARRVHQTPCRLEDRAASLRPQHPKDVVTRAKTYYVDDFKAGNVKIQQRSDAMKILREGQARQQIRKEDHTGKALQTALIGWCKPYGDYARERSRIVRDMRVISKRFLKSKPPTRAIAMSDVLSNKLEEELRVQSAGRALNDDDDEEQDARELFPPPPSVLEEWRRERMSMLEPTLIQASRCASEEAGRLVRGLVHSKIRYMQQTREISEEINLTEFVDEALTAVSDICDIYLLDNKELLLFGPLIAYAVMLAMCNSELYKINSFKLTPNNKAVVKNYQLSQAKLGKNLDIPDLIGKVQEDVAKYLDKAEMEKSMMSPGDDGHDSEKMFSINMHKLAVGYRARESEEDKREGFKADMEENDSTATPESKAEALQAIKGVDKGLKLIVAQIEETKMQLPDSWSDEFKYWIDQLISNQRGKKGVREVGSALGSAMGSPLGDD